MTPQQAVAEIDAYIRQCGGGYSGWYIGIAADPRDRLFNDHNVSEKNGAWIYRDAGAEQGARAVEDYFVGLGCKGGPGGGRSDSRYVYAYKITPTTRE